MLPPPQTEVCRRDMFPHARRHASKLLDLLSILRNGKDHGILAGKRLLSPGRETCGGIR